MKVSSAVKWLNTNSNSGVLPINHEVMRELWNKHPQGKNAEYDYLLSGPQKLVEKVDI